VYKLTKSARRYLYLKGLAKPTGRFDRRMPIVAPSSNAATSYPLDEQLKPAGVDIIQRFVNDPDHGTTAPPADS